MKLKIEKSENLNEVEVTIKYSEENDEVKAIKHALTYFDLQLTCKKEDTFYKIHTKDIYYIDALGHQIFVYTKDDVFDIDIKLYQLEEILQQTPLIRISKNTIVNTKKIKSFKSHINGRMEARLLNEDRIIISRMYVSKLKETLGGNQR